MGRIFISISVLVILLYAGIFPDHFSANFEAKKWMLASVLGYAVAGIGIYAAYWFFSERLRHQHQNSSELRLSIAHKIADTTKEDNAEKWVLSKIASNNILIEEHGVTLLEHSKAVADRIAERDSSYAARIAALAHDIGKLQFKCEEYAYHDKFSAAMLNSVDFGDLAAEERQRVIMAIKYHHDDYVPNNFDDKTMQLIKNLKWADGTTTGIEKVTDKLSSEDIDKSIVAAFNELMKTAYVNNPNTVGIIYTGEILAITESFLREGILNLLEEKIAVQLGSNIKRTPGKTHPAFEMIKKALGDSILDRYYDTKAVDGLFNLRSGIKTIRACVLLNKDKFEIKEEWGNWPFETRVLPWQA